MGRSTTPTYRLQITVAGRGAYGPQAWNTKAYGRPSAATLATQVAAFEASTREVGYNAHLGAETVLRARVVHQFTGETVATYTAPAFAVAA
jgi:hypothetical protein